MLAFARICGDVLASAGAVAGIFVIARTQTSRGREEPKDEIRPCAGTSLGV